MAALLCVLELKIFVWFILKWLNLIRYPIKYGDRHQNYFDTMYNYRDIDENKIFSNGCLNLHIARIAHRWQSGIIQILKEYTSVV